MTLLEKAPDQRTRELSVIGVNGLKIQDQVIESGIVKDTVKQPFSILKE